MSAQLLAPVFVLVIWSIIMLFWMAAFRLPAVAKAKITLEQARGGRGQDLEKIIPPAANWPAHNYAHLMEQPTIFYATVIGLVLLGQGSALNVGLAWSYVLLRIAHSIWQASVNTIPVRAALFLVSTIPLAILAVRGLTAALALSA